MWATLRGLGVPHARLLGGAQGLHTSPVSYGKNLLKKFASKTKKKFWYEGPSLGSHLTYKPSQLEFLTKSTSKRTRKEDHVRLRALNGLLHKVLTDMLCTPEVSQEICDLNVELSKVSLTTDFSACRVFWRATLSEAQNAHTEAVLRRSAAHMRHLLMSQQTLRSMPPIVFVQDKKHAAAVEVDQLLAIADFGPVDEKDNFTQNDFRNPEAPDTMSPCDSSGPATHSSLYGIDHEALNKKIVEYKQRREKGHGGMSPMWPEREGEPTKHMKRRRARPHGDDGLSPQNCLWGDCGEPLPEEQASAYKWRFQEAEQELEVERKDQGNC